MHTFLKKMLACPICYGDLRWGITEQDADHIESAETFCRNCGAIYPVRDGIGIFLPPDLPRNDLWQQVDSGLTRHLSDNPETRQKLVDVPLETLTPADQFFRALALEGRGDYAEAEKASSMAEQKIYTPEYLDCYQQQQDYIVEWLSAEQGPIFDLASGRCNLAILLAQKLNQPIIACDFSLQVLRNNRGRLKFLNLYERISLLAFDARQTPFKPGVVKRLTTNMGLPNITQSISVLHELRRVVDGTFLALSHFYPPGDEANGEAIREFGLSVGLYRTSTLVNFAMAGWQVEVANQCVGTAAPTPRGAILEGMGIDGLPVAETDLEWCVLVAQ